MAKSGLSRRGALQSLTAFLAALGPAAPALAQVLPPRRVSLTPPPQPIEIEARVLAGFERTNAARRQFGRLEFRGGLVLTSPAKEFGGWSGLVMDDSGRRLLAVSDRGHWMMADLVQSAGGLNGLRDAVIGDIAGIGGRRLTGRDADAEGITLLDGTLARGTVLISFERNHRIGRFPVSDRGLEAPTGYLKMPSDIRRVVGFNKGIEAVGVLRGGPLGGSVIAFAEEGFDDKRNHTGWIWPGGFDGEPQRLGLTNIGDFAVTDVASLPDGSLIVLERKFRWLEGVRMRLRLIRAAHVKPGALLEGEMLIEADLGSEIDNMEGLALSRDQHGQTIITLISDNNFNAILQRSLLLQFALGPDTTAKVR